MNERALPRLAELSLICCMRLLRCPPSDVDPLRLIRCCLGAIGQLPPLTEAEAASAQQASCNFLCIPAAPCSFLQPPAASCMRDRIN
eukprot:10520628-Alexandrium_andersonii.AAC.1